MYPGPADPAGPSCFPGRTHPGVQVARASGARSGGPASVGVEPSSDPTAPASPFRSVPAVALDRPRNPADAIGARGVRPTTAGDQRCPASRAAPRVTGARAPPAPGVGTGRGARRPSAATARSISDCAQSGRSASTTASWCSAPAATSRWSRAWNGTSAIPTTAVPIPVRSILGNAIVRRAGAPPTAADLGTYPRGGGVKVQVRHLPLTRAQASAHALRTPTRSPFRGHQLEIGAGEGADRGPTPEAARAA